MANLSQKLPPLGALTAFEASARLLSFTRAGAELHISQAAVSKQIQRLEADLNAVLFERSHRSLRLTSSGHTLYTAVRDGLEPIASCAATLRTRAATEPVSIGLSVSMASHCLMPRLGDFRARYPGIDVRVLAVDRSVDLRAEAIDMAIGYNHKSRLPRRAIELYDEIVLPVCSPQHRAAQGLSDADALAAETLLHLDPEHWQEMGEAPIDWSQWLAHFGAQQNAAPQGLLINNYGMVLQAAVDGHGIALGWRPMVDSLLENGLLAAVLDTHWETGRCHYLVSAERKPRKAVAVFRDWLVENLFKPSVTDD